MTPNEAIEAIKDSNLSFEATEYAISAIEKDIPMKPLNKTSEYGGDYSYCPNCNTIMCDYREFYRCGHCGQRIDWS